MNKKGVFSENIPNMLSIARIILTFVLIYMIFSKSNIISIVIVFSVAAITDFLDGRLARRFNWVSEFGRKADMIADRFLWVGTAVAFLISFGISGELLWYHAVQLLLIMTREVMSAPFAVIAFVSGNMLPKARFVAKVNTFVQGFAIPALLLSIFYPIFIFISLPLSIVCLILGFRSALYYIRDVQIKPEVKNERSGRRKNKNRKS